MLSVALLTHIGVMVLAVAWMGLIWLALLAMGRAHAPAWCALTCVLAASMSIAILVVYAPVIETHLAQVYKIGA